MMDDSQVGVLFMPSPAPARKVATRSVNHAIAEFAQGVQLMSETSSDTQVGDLVAALTRQLEKQVRTRPHPLIYANLAGIISVVFACGVLYQKVNTLEDRVRTMANGDAITLRLQDLSDQQSNLRRDIDGIRDRMDRILDKRR